MNKYVKKILAIIFVIIIVFLGYLCIASSDDEVMAAQQENHIARIDISTDISNSDAPFNVYLNDSTEAEPPANWMKRRDRYGVTIHTEENSILLKIKVQQKLPLNITLLSKDTRDGDDRQIDNWIKYTSLSINGKDALSEPQVVCARKNFKYTIDAKAGKTYTIEAKWQRLEEIPEE